MAGNECATTEGVTTTSEFQADDDVTINLIQLSTMPRHRRRVGLALEPTLMAADHSSRCILDATIIEEESPARESGLGQSLVSSSHEEQLMDVEELLVHITPNRNNRSTAPKPTSTEDNPEVIFHQMARERAEDVHHLQKMCKELIAEKTQLVRDLRDRTDESIHFQRGMHSATRELEDIKIFHQTELTVLEAERQEVQDRYDGLTVKFDGIVKDRDDANRQCEELFTEVHMLRRQIRKLGHIERAKECLQEKFDELQKAFDDLQRAAASSSGDGQLTPELEALKAENADLAAQLERAKEELEAFRSAALELARESEMESERRDEDFAKLESRLEESNERIRPLREAIEKLEIKNLNRRSQDAKRLQELEKENQFVKEQLAVESDRENHLDEMVVRLERCCDDADSTEAANHAEIEALKAQVQKVERQSKLDQDRVADANAACEKAQMLERELGKKIAAIIDLGEQLAIFKDKYRALGDKSQRLKASKSGSDFAQGNNDSAPAAAGGGSIAEMERHQLVEQELYQTRKQLGRLEKEVAKLREENQQLRNTQQSIQIQDKENSVHGTPGSLRRAMSESEKSSGSRALQESAMPNRPAGNLFTTTNRPQSRTRYFPQLSFAKK